MANGKRESFQADLADPLSGTFRLPVYDFYKTNGTKSSDHAVGPGGPSMTRQEFAEDCDINSIMARYENTGASINGLSRHPDLPGVYVDFTGMPGSLLEYQQFMSDASASFMSLPARVRKEFENDPVAFCDFASDPANLEQMRDWGLAPKAPAVVAPVVGPVPSSPAPGAPAPAAAPASAGS